MEDPYLWLEDVHGEKPLAWVKEQNAKSLGVLKADPDYQKDYDNILSVLDATDRIPFGWLDHQYVFNFWQDADHHKGIWRRTTIADYANPQPKWETILDVDKLSADEHANWVWKGAECTDDLSRCLIALSPGGGDAKVMREFDMATKTFVKDGFVLPEAKSNMTWLDNDTVLVGTDFGPGTMTTSGYGRIVKLWKRGTPLASAKMIYGGENNDVSIDPFVLHSKDEVVPLVQRSVSFFEADYFLVNRDGTTTKLALPRSAIVQGLQAGRLLIVMREDWTPPGGKTIPKGALIAAPVHDVAKAEVLYAPGPRASVEQIAVGRDAVYAAIYENVVGQVRAFRFDGAKWDSTAVALPPGGSVNIVSTNLHGPEAEFRFENFLTPTTLYADEGSDKPVAIKSLPAAFRCVEPHERAIRGDVERRHEDSLFRHAPESAERADADRALRLRRLRSVNDARLFREFRTAVAQQGRRLCAGEHPRRRRVRTRLASGGAEGKSPEGL